MFGSTEALLFGIEALQFGIEASLRGSAKSQKSNRVSVGRLVSFSDSQLDLGAFFLTCLTLPFY